VTPPDLGDAIEIAGADVFIGPKQILHDVNWKVRRGEHWFVLGPNGAGKTTLTKLVMGYLWPRYGATVRVLGNLYGECDLAAVRSRVAWVSPYLQTWTGERGWLVWEVVVSGVDASVGLFRAPRPVELDRAREALDSLGCAQLFERRFDSLSSGEQVKALVGRALMTNPELLVLDEACAFLDIGSREHLLETIHALAVAPYAPTIIFVTQRIEDILPAFEKGLAIKDGRFVAAGARDAVLTEETLLRTFGLHVHLVKAADGRLWPVLDGFGSKPSVQPQA